MRSRRRKAPSVPASLQRSASASNRRFSLPENWRRRAIATPSGSRRAAPSEAVSPVALRASSATASEEEPNDPFIEDFSNELMCMSYLYSKLPERGVSPHIDTGGGEPKSQQSLQAADLLLPNVEHEVKRTWSTDQAEIAILALIGSLSRPNVKDHRSSTRIGLCAVLPSVDGRLASEICCLLSAYDELKLPTKRSAKARDHFVWLKPYRPKKDEPVSFAELPRPFLDVGRAQRLVERESGQWEVWACANNTIRVTGTDPWLDGRANKLPLISF